MSEKNKELLLKTPKEKIEELAKSLESDPENEEICTVLYVVAGSTMLGPEGQASLAVWVATWADSVINEANKIKEEGKVEDLTNKIINPDNE